VRAGADKGLRTVAAPSVKLLELFEEHKLACQTAADKMHQGDRSRILLLRLVGGWQKEIQQLRLQLGLAS